MKLPQYRLLKISQKDHTTLEAEWIDIVTCEECKWWLGFCSRIDGLFEPNDDDFCSYGERRE